MCFYLNLTKEVEDKVSEVHDTIYNLEELKNSKSCHSCPGIF